jgi:hypothetical protein
MATGRKKTKAKARVAPKAPKKAPAKAPAPKKKEPEKAKPKAAAPQAPPPAKSESAARPGPAAAGGAAPAKPAPRAPGGAKKSSRRTPLSLRRGPNGELLAPGDLILPGGPQTAEEIQYLFRGCVAAERAAAEAGVNEVILKRGAVEPSLDRGELARQMEGLAQRFASGTIETSLPVRPPARRTFSGVVERARQRRREIGAFLRGLDLGRTETSHMDSHGEASLQSLMEWAARLEKLAEAEEPEQGDYTQFHRGLDQLDHTTEALIVDVELTLRRLGARFRT